MLRHSRIVMNLPRVCLMGHCFAYSSLIICLWMLCVPVARLCAQGTVGFLNDNSTLVYTCDSGGMVPVPAGNAFQVGLYYAPDGTSQAEYDYLAIRLGDAVGFGPVAGRFNGGARTAPTPGGVGMFQVRGWETAYGNSYEEVIVSGMGSAGKSGIMRIQTGNPTTTPAGTPTPLVSGGFRSFYFGPLECPEPSSFAIVGLGLGTVILWRAVRKNSR
jgi:hypothetical protein